MSRLAIVGLVPTMVMLPIPLLANSWSPIVAVVITLIVWVELGAQLLFHLDNLDRLHSPRLLRLNERLHSARPWRRRNRQN